MKRYIVLIISILMCSCASKPSPDEIARLKSLNYGDYPKNYDEVIKDFIKNGNTYGNIGIIPELIVQPSGSDIENNKFEYMFEPKKDFVGDKNGYGVCVKIPTSGPFGMKIKPLWYFLISNGKVVSFEKPGGDSFSRGYIAGLCDSLKERTYL